MLGQGKQGKQRSCSGQELPWSDELGEAATLSFRSSALTPWQRGPWIVGDVLRVFSLVGIMWSVSAGWCGAQDYHPWAQFEIGCWKQVRVVTETLGADGKVESVSTADTKTTLTATDDTSYTLKVEAAVELAGRRFQAEPKFVKQGLFGEIPGQTPEIKSLGSAEVVIGGRRFPTEIQEVAVVGTEGRKVSTFHISEGVSPYVLKRETKVGIGTADPPILESQVEVLAVDMPFKVLSQVRPVAFVRTVQKQHNAVALSTIEVQCAEVPGVVVAHSSQEFDASGRIVRRSTLELVDYRVVQPARASTPLKDEPRRRLFRHFRTRRP